MNDEYRRKVCHVCRYWKELYEPIHYLDLSGCGAKRQEFYDNCPHYFWKQQTKTKKIEAVAP
jgi:hypothetical protein